MQTLKPFPSVIRALREILRTYDGLLVPLKQVGMDFPANPTDYYIRIDPVPGGRSGIHQGGFIYDVEVYHPKYSMAESGASDIEAILLGYSGIVNLPGEGTVRVDKIEENALPSEIPWDDDTVTRFLATYVLTVRR